MRRSADSGRREWADRQGPDLPVTGYSFERHGDCRHTRAFAIRKGIRVPDFEDLDADVHEFAIASREAFDVCNAIDDVALQDKGFSMVAQPNDSISR